MDLDNLECAEGRFDEALLLFTVLGDAEGMADIIDSRAMKMFGHGDITERIAAFDRVAKLFTDTGNLLRVADPPLPAWLGPAFAGRPQEGLADTETANELARSLGYAPGRGGALAPLGSAGQMRPEEALAAAESAPSVARRVGYRGWTAPALLGVGRAGNAHGNVAGAPDAFA